MRRVDRSGATTAVVVDYENARLIAGRAPEAEDFEKPVAVVGKLYARQRLGLTEPTGVALGGREVSLNGKPFRVVGIYTTENDFGDNHVFIPLGVFRETFHPGKRLGKIFVTGMAPNRVSRLR